MLETAEVRFKYDVSYFSSTRDKRTISVNIMEKSTLVAIREARKIADVARVVDVQFKGQVDINKIDKQENSGQR